MLWEILQNLQIGRNREHHLSLEQRVAHIELTLDRHRRALEDLVRDLEHRDGRDVDGDGQIG